MHIECLDLFLNDIWVFFTTPPLYNSTTPQLNRVKLMFGIHRKLDIYICSLKAYLFFSFELKIVTPSSPTPPPEW